MHRSPLQESSVAATETAVLRLDAYLDEVAGLLEAEGIAREKVEEVLLSAGEMALEMFTLGRRSQRRNTSLN